MRPLEFPTAIQGQSPKTFYLEESKEATAQLFPASLACSHGRYKLWSTALPAQHRHPRLGSGIQRVNSWPARERLLVHPGATVPQPWLLHLHRDPSSLFFTEGYLHGSG